MANTNSKQLPQYLGQFFPCAVGRALINVISAILDAGQLLALKVGDEANSPTSITQIKVYSQTITPAAVNAATVAEQTFTVTGLTTADKVIVNPAATGNATGIAGVRVSAADTLAISFVNPTAGSLTPGAGTYNIVAIRS